MRHVKRVFVCVCVSITGGCLLGKAYRASFCWFAVVLARINSELYWRRRTISRAAYIRMSSCLVSCLGSRAPLFHLYKRVAVYLVGLGVGWGDILTPQSCGIVLVGEAGQRRGAP